jgi:hypothetical protein
LFKVLNRKKVIKVINIKNTTNFSRLFTQQFFCMTSPMVSKFKKKPPRNRLYASCKSHHLGFNPFLSSYYLHYTTKIT